MAVYINQNFSVYQHILPDTSRNIFSNNGQMLAHWCASIEKEIINQSIPLTLFVGFQKLDHFVPMMERYKSIAQVANHVYVFGEPSEKVKAIPNITYVHLAHHAQLRNEWFLVAYHKDYARALIALETTPSQKPHHERTFKGVLTSDAEMILPIYQQLTERVSPLV